MQNIMYKYFINIWLQRDLSGILLNFALGAV